LRGGARPRARPIPRDNGSTNELTRERVRVPTELALPRDSRARLLPRHDVLEHLVEVPDDDELRRRRNPRSLRTLTSPGAPG
jgi:hypothetical protein